MSDYGKPQVEEACKIIVELLQDLAVNLERIENALKVIEKNGCDCDCEHHWEDHDEDCELCLACLIEHELNPRAKRWGDEP